MKYADKIIKHTIKCRVMFILIILLLPYLTSGSNLMRNSESFSVYVIYAEKQRTLFNLTEMTRKQKMQSLKTDNVQRLPFYRLG